MTRTANVPMFFLWFNLDFKKDRDLLPKVYVKRLKEEIQARRKAGITAPLCFIYRSSFLLSDKSKQIQAIKDLGVQVFDYDELVKIKKYKQNEISSFFTREVMEDVLKSNKRVAENSKADFIDDIKLEVLYNYAIIIGLIINLIDSKKLGWDLENGCIIQDFDVALDYEAFNKEIASKLDEDLDKKLFFGPMPENYRVEDGAENNFKTYLDEQWFFIPIPKKYRVGSSWTKVENNFIYVSKPNHPSLKELMEFCDKDKRKSIGFKLSIIRSIMGHLKSFPADLKNKLKLNQSIMDLNKSIVDLDRHAVYYTIVRHKDISSFSINVFRVMESHKTWRYGDMLDKVYSVRVVDQDPTLYQDELYQDEVDSVLDSGLGRGLDSNLRSGDTVKVFNGIILYAVITVIVAVVQVMLARKNGILNDKIQAASVLILVVFALVTGAMLIYEKNKQQDKDRNEVVIVPSSPIPVISSAYVLQPV